MRSIPSLAGSCLASALLLISSSTVHAQTRELATSGVLLDRVAAVVNEGVVLKSELDAQIERISRAAAAKKQELPPQNILRQQILEQLVTQELELQHAERRGMKVSDEMLNNAVKMTAEQNKLTLDQLPQALESQGINYAAYRDSIRKQMIIEGLQHDVLMRISITPREVDQYLAKQTNSLANEEFEVSHILISVPSAAAPEELEKSKARADEVYQKAKAGEDFSKLAVTYSNSQTSLEGGKLGWRKGPELPGFIAELVGKMQPGEISEPVRTPSGFHLVKLNDRRSSQDQVIVNQVHARHILIKPNDLQDDETVKQKLVALRERILKGEDFAALATTTSEDPGSAPQGGDLGWTGDGTFVPEFEKTLASLNKDEISQPFKTQYGWHIIQLLDRRVQDVTEEKRRQQAFAALRESRADEEIELWLRRLRDEAYIEYKI